MGGGAGAGDGAGAGAGAAGAGGFGDLGFDPNMDPEMAAAIRMSLEEAKQREEA